MKILRTPSREGRRAERSMQRAVARVMEENRRLGLPVAVMYKGKAALVPVDVALAEAKATRISHRAKPAVSKSVKQ